MGDCYYKLDPIHHRPLLNLIGEYVIEDNLFDPILRNVIIMYKFKNEIYIHYVSGQMLETLLQERELREIGFYDFIPQIGSMKDI